MRFINFRIIIIIILIIIYERLDVFCINIGNTSASQKLEQFVVVIMSLDLLVSEGHCSTFVNALLVVHANDP